MMSGRLPQDFPTMDKSYLLGYICFHNPYEQTKENRNGAEINMYLLLQLRASSVHLFPLQVTDLDLPPTATYPVIHTNVTLDPSGNSFVEMSLSDKTTFPSKLGFEHCAMKTNDREGGQKPRRSQFKV